MRISNWSSDVCSSDLTSRTTGNPKCVLYSHRSNYIHALMTLQRDALALSARDTVLLVVPMYHSNAWGVVYSAPAVGAKLVLPGQRMDGESIYNLIERERSEEHTSELQSLMRISYAVFCLKKKTNS